MKNKLIQSVVLPSGIRMPVLGQGTWRMGESSLEHQAEVDTLRVGLDLGMTLIDTAEMYAEGGAEVVVGDAIAGRRDQVFLTTKALPTHARRRDLIQACERSLSRLQTDRIDLYLLHYPPQWRSLSSLQGLRYWRSSIPPVEVFETLQELRQSGKVRDFGVSNFSVKDMKLARQYDNGLTATNQVFYNLNHRGIEWDLLPQCRSHKIPVMAYSPLERSPLLNNPVLQKIASDHHATPAQIAIAWLLHQENIAVVTKTSRVDRVRENSAALDLRLSESVLTELDRAFPPPHSPQELQFL
ncbi:aldo/keto reductase [Phormidesmis priestleyi]